MNKKQVMDQENPSFETAIMEYREMKMKEEIMNENIYVPSGSEKDVIDGHFQRLKKELEKMELHTESGGTRKVHVGEFMLMHIDGQERVHFKHSHTRNYVFLHLDGTIEVPFGYAFHRGFFDEMPG